MDSVVTFLENVVKYAAEVGIRLVELAGIMVLLITAVQGIILYFKHDPNVRLKLAEGIALSLEFKLGGEVLRRAGVSADLLRPLIAETTAKALAAARPAAVQTGPAVRGDLPTQERHLRLLADDALLSDIYRLITQSIWETSRKIS